MKANVSTGNTTHYIVARLTGLFTALVLTIAFIVNCVSADTTPQPKDAVAQTPDSTFVQASAPDLSQFPNKTYLPILINRQRSTAVWDLNK